MTLIFGLVAAGLVLLFFEVILPGGVLGLLGLACVIGATWVGFAEFGVFGGSFTLLGSLAAAVALIYIEFKWLGRSRLGKQFFLSSSVSGHSNEPQGEASLVGREALAITRLNPSGRVSIEGKVYEAYSQDGYIESGESVLVAKRDNFKLIITKLKKS
ncbi:MAG: NfeD family protein [Opitutales bacterium]